MCEEKGSAAQVAYLLFCLSAVVNEKKDEAALQIPLPPLSYDDLFPCTCGDGDGTVGREVVMSVMWL